MFFRQLFSAILILPLLALSIVHNVGTAGDGDYGRWLTNNTKTVIENIKIRLYPTISLSERRIVKAIRFKFHPSTSINAQAYTLGSTPYVRIFRGYLMVIDQLSIAFIVDEELGYSGCYKEVLLDIYDLVNKNTVRSTSGLATTQPLLSVWGRALDQNSSCYGLTHQEFTEDPGTGRRYARLAEGALAYMTLHEIAHHVLGHTQSDGSITTLKHIRIQETEADYWAFKKALEIKVNPIAGAASWTFFSILDGADISSEERSTHPLSLRRFIRMLETVLAMNSTSEYKDIRNNSLPKDQIEDIQSVIDRFEDLIE